MAAYQLKATHSLTLDRSQGPRRGEGTIKVRCILAVPLVALQPFISALLRTPLDPRRSDTIRIEGITSYRGDYGTRVWHFTIVLQTSAREARTRTAMGGLLEIGELRRAPLGLMHILEQALKRVWYKVTEDDAALSAQFYGELRLLR